MERKRFGRHSSQGEVPSPEVPGEVIVSAPGLKPEDINELGKVAAEFLPGSKAHKWFKKTFENEEGKKNAKFYVGVATVGFIVGGAIVEHLRGYRDVGELRDKVKEAKDKWVEEKLPRIKQKLPKVTLNKENQKEFRVMTMHQFIEIAKRTRDLSVSPVLYPVYEKVEEEGKEKRGKKIGMSTYLRFKAVDEEREHHFFEILGKQIAIENWDEPTRRIVEKRISAQAEQQRRRLASILGRNQDELKLIIGEEEIGPELRDELFEIEPWDNFSELDKVVFNGLNEESEAKPRKFRLFGRK